VMDGKFGRAETPALGRAIDGICAEEADDLARIARGTELFDRLYENLRKVRA